MTSEILVISRCVVANESIIRAYYTRMHGVCLIYHREIIIIRALILNICNIQF